SWPHNRPVERAVFYQALLYALVIISAPKNQSEWQKLKATDTFVAVACAESGDADQAFHCRTFHSAHQNARCVGEKADRPKQIPQRNAQSLDHDVYPVERFFNVFADQRIAADFLQFWIGKANRCGRAG